MGIQHVRFLREGIAFDRYPYAGARVHPCGLVRWSEVLEADPKATPPELRIAGETLFVSAELRDEFSRVAEAHGVPTEEAPAAGAETPGRFPVAPRPAQETDSSIVRLRSGPTARSRGHIN